MGHRISFFRSCPPSGEPTLSHNWSPWRGPYESPKELLMLPCSHWAPLTAWQLHIQLPASPTFLHCTQMKKHFPPGPTVSWISSGSSSNSLEESVKSHRHCLKLHHCVIFVLKLLWKISHDQKRFLLSYVFPSHLDYCCSLWYCKSQPRPTNQLSHVLAVTAGEGFHPRGSKSRIWSKIS